MSVKIIVDSTADMSPAAKARVSAVVPLSVRFGDAEYKDGATIIAHEFYEMLADYEELPTSSQPTPMAFSDAFEAATADGSEAVVITISSRLSGTYQGARIAAEDFDGKVQVCDSRSAAVGAGVLAEYALQLADKGLSAQEILDELMEARKNIRIFFMVDTLEYLKKGGRISSAVALAGGLLNIKPVLAIEDGAIHILGKARGSKMGNNLLVQEIEKAGGVDFSKPVLMGYTGMSDTLLVKYIEDSKHLWEGNLAEVRYATIGSVIGTHAGPGAVAVAFFKK